MVIEQGEVIAPRLGGSAGSGSSDIRDRRPKPSTTTVVVLALIVIVGAIVRCAGWGGGGLFFDDAWAALPARVPLENTFHMWLSAPGYILLQREWTALAPDNLRWVLAPSLILGIVAPIVAFGLCRILRFPDWVGLTMAGFVAVEQCAIQFSLAVKPFEFELVAGMALLGAADIVRRNRTTRLLVALSICSVVAVAMDGSLLVVVIGIWSALVLIALLDRPHPSATIPTALFTGLVVVPLAWLIQSGIPPYDQQFFRALGTLVGPPYTFSHLYHVFVVSGGGLAHGMFSTPNPFVVVGPIPTGTAIFIALATVVELAMLVILAWPAVNACIRKDLDAPAIRELASALVIVVALLAYLAGKLPLGDGRTDLVVLPAVIVLLASGLQRLGAFLNYHVGRETVRRLGVVAAVVVALSASVLAWGDRSWYPTQALNALDRKIAQHRQPNDVLLVSFRNSYTWAYDQLTTPYRLHFSAVSGRSLGIGYWVTFRSPHVLVERSSADPGVPGLAELPSTDHRLWLIGNTLLNASPSTVHFTGALAGVPAVSNANAVLLLNGWRPTSTMLTATGVFAVLYVRR